MVNDEISLQLIMILAIHRRALTRRINRLLGLISTPIYREMIG
jgi:hypothetical protein